MANTTISPNMSLIIPTVAQDPGPDWANNINASLQIVDAHDHSPGSGVQITPLGLNINSNLNFNSNQATNIYGLAFSSPASNLTTSSLYTAPQSGGGVYDLFFNDGAGNIIPLTKAGIVNSTAASIPGESYSAGTFTWKQGSGSTTPANFDIGSIVLRPNVASTTFGVTLSPPSAISSAYSLALPPIPGATSFMTLDTGGNIVGSISTSGGITGSNIASQTLATANYALLSVTTAIINTGAVTKAKLAANIIGSPYTSTSSVIGFSTSTIGSPVSITGAAATITTTGQGAVEICFYPVTGSTPFPTDTSLFIQGVGPNTIAAANLNAQFQCFNNTNSFWAGATDIGTSGTSNNGGGVGLAIKTTHPISALRFFDASTVGTNGAYSYAFNILVTTSGSPTSVSAGISGAFIVVAREVL